MPKLTTSTIRHRPNSSFWRSNASFFRTAFHGFLCIAALILGFRISGDAVFFLHLSSSKGALFFRKSSSRIMEGLDVALKFPYIPEADLARGSQRGGGGGGGDEVVVVERKEKRMDLSSLHRKRSKRVHVGRHEILIRPQPHPDPAQILRAHQLLHLVQHQQLLLHSHILPHKPLIAITPTFSRTFQSLHLLSVIHSLRSSQTSLTWIVVEAPATSNETSSLLSNSGLPYHHLGFPISTEMFWQDRPQLEALLRSEGLRFVRQQRLDGIIVFVDDSNTHSLEFFAEAQKTEWVGTFSVGLLQHHGLDNLNKQVHHQSLPVQGPSCGPDGHVIGWYTPKEAQMPGRRSLEWAGFSLNARLLWQDSEIPAGFRCWDDIFGGSYVESPLDFVANVSVVEPLGNCGRDVLVWWQRVEARSDSKFPSKWVIDPQLEVLVPSKRTPWPDPPPRSNVLPSPITVISGQRKHKTKRSAKGRTRKGIQHVQSVKRALVSNFEQQ